jgi:acyl-ACP thioesterase
MERGYTWVVALMDVAIGRIPRYDDTIAVETWPGPFRRILCPRFYQIRILPKTEEERMARPDGEVVCRATSIWSILDIEKRIAVNPVAEGLVAAPDVWTLPDAEPGSDEALTMAMARPRAVRPGNTENRSEFTVPFSYVDMNGHMNNTRYPDILCSFLSTDMRGQRVISMGISFLSEAPLGETLKFYTGQSDGVHYVRTVRENGMTNVDAEILLEPLEPFEPTGGSV